MVAALGLRGRCRTSAARCGPLALAGDVDVRDFAACCLATVNTGSVGLLTSISTSTSIYGDQYGLIKENSLNHIMDP